MTGEEVHAALRTLGEMWGLGRPLHVVEMARTLGLTGAHAGDQVRKWINHGPTGPAGVAIEALLATGYRPSTFESAIRRR